MKELLQPHPQAEWLIAMAQGKPVQRLTVEGLWVGASLNCLCNHPSGTFRIKPEVININSFKVPAPVREPLNYREEYYIPNERDDPLYTKLTWLDDNIDKRLLARGLIHCTKEAAIAHAEALLSFTRSDK